MSLVSNQKQELGRLVGMETLLLVISCLLFLTNHQQLYCSEATQNVEYPFPFMIADAEKAAARTYDYIVVGGDTAGCPLAATLSQNYSVLVLERGDSAYGNPDVKDNEGVFKLLGNASEFPYVAEGFVSEDGVQLARARVLGGGTAINGGFYSRASLDYIRKMEWNEKLVNESYEWVEKMNAFKPNKLFRWSSAVKDAQLGAGLLPYNGYTLNHLEGTKISASSFDNNGRRHTAADLLKYANPDNIVVLLNATASRLLFNTSSGKVKVVGVEFMSSVDGLSHQVLINQLLHQSEVSLSAGSIGSPQLLLLSGIGPSQQLRELNITVLLDLNYVGKGIQDPPRATFVIESPEPLEFSQIQVVCIIDNSQIYIESASYLQQENDTAYQYLAFISSKVAFPLSRGELQLRTKNPQDSPFVRYNYYSHPYDLQECMFGVKVLSNLSITTYIQKFAFKASRNSSILQFFGSTLPQNQSDNKAFAMFCRDTLATTWHYHGGCQIDYVVDKMHHVKGVDNLRVVDNSIFKDSPRTNPQATTMMVGK